jgi:hypothetical protein
VPASAQLAHQVRTDGAEAAGDKNVLGHVKLVLFHAWLSGGLETRRAVLLAHASK